MTTEQLIADKHRVPTAARNVSSSLVQILETVVIISAVFGFQGCGDYDHQPPEITKQAVKFDEVPEAVRSAASKALPGIKLNEAWKNLGRGGKLHSYEIRGKNPADGKTREVRVSLAGEILEME